MSKVVVFDLDDTLFKEIDFLTSAYSEISVFVSTKIDVPDDELLSEMLFNYNQGINVFNELLKKYDSLNLSVKDLLEIYRNHIPFIKLKDDVSHLLEMFDNSQIPMGIITDGRSIQQRNKIKALCIKDYFEHIIISEEFGSEKPSLKNYMYFEDIYREAQYFYIGDNTSKDFISPNKLSWTSICLLDDGRNIHKQDFKLAKEYLPKYKVEKISDIEEIIFNNSNKKPLRI